MERLAEALAAFEAWWAARPAIPDLALPDPGDADVLIVIATVVTLLGLMGLVTGWVEGRFSSISLGAALLGGALFFWLWEAERDAFTAIRIPEAFVEIVARTLR